MTNEWIIDVLADLRQYALRHRYMALAEQLDDALVVAAGELFLENEQTGLRPASGTGPAAGAQDRRAPRPLAPITAASILPHAPAR